MTGTHEASRDWSRRGAAILGVLVAAGCAARASHRQTEVMEKSGKVSVSAAELRVRLNALADRFADQYEETADRVRAQTKDRAVRRRALAFKVDAVPAVYAAAYRTEPLAAVVDVWALAFQAVQYFEDGVETLETVTERLNTYAAHLPKLARWQAELLVSEQAGEHDVQAALADVAALGATARRANALLDDVPALVSAGGAPVRDLVAAERQTVLDAVNHQRLQTLDYATAERVAVVGVLREERVATLAALRQERIEALKEVDAIKTRAVESAISGLRDPFDYALWRVGVVVIVMMAAATVLGVVGYRLSIGRRPHPA
jgi:outer membrane murein-binding lipoprotein Lpp